MIETVGISATCYLSGMIVARGSIYYSSGRLEIWPLTNLWATVVGLTWLILSAVLCVRSLSEGGWVAAVTGAGQLLIFPLLASIDLEVQQVPTLLVRVGSSSIAACMVICRGDLALVPLICGATLFMAPLVLVNILQPNAVGAGDIRLGTYLGPLLSSQGRLFAIPVALAVASFLALFVSLCLAPLLGRSQKRIPLVPFLLCGVFAAQLMPVQLFRA